MRATAGALACGRAGGLPNVLCRKREIIIEKMTSMFIITSGFKRKQGFVAVIGVKKNNIFKEMQ